jgi:hypothetical protein
MIRRCSKRNTQVRGDKDAQPKGTTATDAACCSDGPMDCRKDFLESHGLLRDLEPRCLQRWFPAASAWEYHPDAR